MKYFLSIKNSRINFIRLLLILFIVVWGVGVVGCLVWEFFLWGWFCVVGVWWDVFCWLCWGMCFLLKGVCGVGVVGVCGDVVFLSFFFLNVRCSERK